jgi:23S rRNA (guanosine2251-2'-O)-methyltransferase
MADRDGGGNLVCGINAVAELLQRERRRVQHLYGQENPGRRLQALLEKARARGIAVKLVPAAALDQMAPGVRHQGVAAVVAPFRFTPLKELLSTGSSPGRESSLLVALDGITDPRNLGAIIRSAAAAGADGLILPERRSAAITANVGKAAAGALESLAISQVVNLAEALRRCRESGFWIYGAAAAGGEELYSVDWASRVVLVLGSEDRGLRPIIARACDHQVTIPLAAESESLNVGIAAAVILFELNRCRRQTRTDSVSRSVPCREKDTSR